MSKVIKFARLDVLAIKPILQSKIFVVTTVGFYSILMLVLGCMVMGLLLSLLMGSIYVSHLFTHKLDILCLSLAIDRKTIVKGRFITTYIGLIIFSLFAFGLGRLLVSFSFNTLLDFECDCCIAINAERIITMFLVVMVIQIMIQVILLPIKFVEGHGNKLICLVIPIAAFSTTRWLSELPNITDVTASMNGRVIMATVAAVVAVAIYVSYRISLAIYTKREF